MVKRTKGVYYARYSLRKHEGRRGQDDKQRFDRLPPCARRLQDSCLRPGPSSQRDPTFTADLRSAAGW